MNNSDAPMVDSPSIKINSKLNLYALSFFPLDSRAVTTPSPIIGDENDHKALSPKMAQHLYFRSLSSHSLSSVSPTQAQDNENFGLNVLFSSSNS